MRIEREEAQKIIDDIPIQRFHLYQHYKGGMYIVLAVAIDEATLKPVVVYQGVKDRTVWVRSYEDFIQPIQEAQNVPRFVKVS